MNFSQPESSQPRGPAGRGSLNPRLRPRWLLLLVLVLLVSVAGAWLSAQRRGPQPRITWSENQLEVILSPGESATRNLTFTSTLDVQNLVIEPVPELAPFLTVAPGNVPNLTAGQAQSVELAFSIPADAVLGTYDGTVHVRVGSQTLPQTLKMAVNVWQQFRHDPLALTLYFPPNWLLLSAPGDENVLLDPGLYDEAGRPLVGIAVISEPASGATTLNEFLTRHESFWSQSEFDSLVVSGLPLGLYDEQSTVVDGRPALNQLFGAQGGWAQRIFVHDEDRVVIYEISSEIDNFSEPAIIELRRLLEQVARASDLE